MTGVTPLSQQKACHVNCHLVFFFSITMSSKSFVVLVAFVSLCFAQVTEIKSTIDPFTVTTPTIVILLTATSQYPVSDSRFTVDNSILGGERDLILTVDSGTDGLIVSSGVNGGRWDVGTPNGASGFVLMQYDGSDNSATLNRNGLGVNLLANSANSFRAVIQSDIDTEYTFRVFSGSSQSTFTQSIPGDDTSREYVFPFTSFSGSANFANVGAIEIQINANDNVDTFVEFFGTTGPQVETVTPSPLPSASTSRGPAKFTWYTFDDDDNGREPCNDTVARPNYFVNDANVIYYYFYGFDDYVTINSATGLCVSILILCLSVLLL